MGEMQYTEIPPPCQYGALTHRNSNPKKYLPHPKI